SAQYPRYDYRRIRIFLGRDGYRMSPGRVFTKKRGPHVVSLKATRVDYAVARVQVPGLSVREAGAVVVAELGWGAKKKHQVRGGDRPGEKKSPTTTPPE